MSDQLENDPTHANLIKNCNTELPNNAFKELDCYANYVVYVIKKVKSGLVADVVKHVEAIELQHELGMLHDRIETIDKSIMIMRQQDIDK